MGGNVTAFLAIGVSPLGWDTAEVETMGTARSGAYDGVVLAGVLGRLEMDRHERLLRETRRVLVPGGVLRAWEPSILDAFSAWNRGRSEWFEDDEQDGDLDRMLLRWMNDPPRLVHFTDSALVATLEAGGYGEAMASVYRSTRCGDYALVDADGPESSLFVEAIR